MLFTPWFQAYQRLASGLGGEGLSREWAVEAKAWPQGCRGQICAARSSSAGGGSLSIMSGTRRGPRSQQRRTSWTQMRIWLTYARGCASRTGRPAPSSSARRTRSPRVACGGPRLFRRALRTIGDDQEPHVRNAQETRRGGPAEPVKLWRAFALRGELCPSLGGLRRAKAALFSGYRSRRARPSR